MNEMEIKIYYLCHSGFAVQTKSHFLIFDYYKDSVDNGSKTLINGVVGEDDIIEHKNIFVFCSHSHGDHYNPVILKWPEINPGIKYILSNDINADTHSDNIIKVSPYCDYTLDDVQIKTYGSTDMGVSFMINVDGVTIFHAGDLNWWYWLDDPIEEIEHAEAWFKEEMDKIKKEPIDIAFFPVDPRLKEKYSLGGEDFIKKFNPRYFIPMHFWENFDITKKFKNIAGDYPSEVIEITRRGQEITLSI